MSSVEKIDNRQIWFLSHTYLPAIGGIENYLREVGKQFRQRGYRVGVICRRTDPRLPEEEEIEGVRVIRHPDFAVPTRRLPVKHRYLTDAIARWLEESGLLREGAVICRYPPYQCAVSRLSGAPPSLYIPASVWPALAARMIPTGRIKEKIFARIWRKQAALLEKTALEKAGRVIVFSRNMQTQLQEYYGTGRKRITVNPPGVDADRFAPEAPSPTLRAELDLPPGTPVVMYAGRLSPEKNLLFLFRALSPLLRKGECRLLLVGGGPMREELEREGRRLDIVPAVRFTGSIRDPVKYFSLADIFVSPSRYESFGQAILEAMASARPVIALKNFPPRIRVAADEIIEEEKSGFIVPEDSDSLLEKVRVLIDSPLLRKKMGERGREICREKFTWERHVSRLLDELACLRTGGDGSA